MSKILLGITALSVAVAVGAVLWGAGLLPRGSESAAFPAGPGLGRDAPPELVAALDISIAPDGAGLPPGQGTSQDGIRTYGQLCAACHGNRGRGGMGGRLTGGIGTLNSDDPIRTVNSYWPYATTVFDYIRRAMPLGAPQTLTDDQVYGLVAFLLSVDRIVEPGEAVNAETLPRIRMPNRNGFVEWWPDPPVN